MNVLVAQLKLRLNEVKEITGRKISIAEGNNYDKAKK